MQRRAVVAILAVLAVAGIELGVGTSDTTARFLDVEAGGTATVAAGTVVLDRAGTVALSYGSLSLVTSTRTRTLRVDNRGSLAATIQFQLPSNPTTGTGCVLSNGTWADRPNVGTLTITLGTRAAEPFCALFDHVPRTIVTTLAPNAGTDVTIRLTAGQLLGAQSRTENTTVVVRATNGFTDQVTGTISVSTSLLGLGLASAAPPGANRLAVRTPEPQAPPECAAAGLTSFAETITLTAADPRFDAAVDRPGVDGPFLVLGTDGTDGADRVVGSPGADCIVGGGGPDSLDGAAGPDVLVGGDGDDRLDGAAGDDRLFGQAGADVLTGGAGSDVLDGGPDGATCDTEPAEAATGCAAPAVPPTTGPPTTPVARATPVVPTATPVAPASPAVPVAPVEPVAQPPAARTTRTTTTTATTEAPEPAPDPAPAAEPPASPPRPTPVEPPRAALPIPATSTADGPTSEPPAASVSPE